MINTQTRLSLIRRDKLQAIKDEARINAYRECIAICENNRDVDNAISDMEKIIRSLESKILEDVGH